MKLDIKLLLLTSTFFIMKANADCGKELDNLWQSSFKIGGISAALPENLANIDSIKEILANEIATEISVIQSSTKECLSHLGGTNESDCAKAIKKYSHVSRELGYVLTNGENEPRPDTGKLFVDAKAKIVEVCSKK